MPEVKRSKPLLSAEELLHQYAAGRRDFANVVLADGDLAGVDLAGIDLVNANLAGVNLSRANLSGARLVNAGLHRANLVLADLRDADLGRVDLRNSNLTGTNAGGARMEAGVLVDANLRGASFAESNLLNTDLRGADLRGADLRGADLRGADIRGANLGGTDLDGADLRGANLVTTDLGSANLGNARLGGALLGGSDLVDLDLSPLCEAFPPVEHQGPSYVDHRAILRSLWSPNLEAFLRRAGMPEVFVTALVEGGRSLRTHGSRILRSTFIRYDSPDQPFARKLYEALYHAGVSAFFSPADAAIDEETSRMTRGGIVWNDRIVLVCSKGSLDREGVIAEIERTLARENRDGVAYVIPVVIDDYLFSGWEPASVEVALALRGRVSADFRGWATEPAKFDVELRRLIGLLAE